MKIMMINGPNLNLLGIREPQLYGDVSLKDIESSCSLIALEHESNLLCFQSNAEHHIIEYIHHALDFEYDGIIINAAAYSHTSIAIRDALVAVNLPFCVVHLTNVKAREVFRKMDYLEEVATHYVSNMGVQGYEIGLRWLLSYIEQNR